MNNIDRKKTSDRYSEAIVQPLFAGFSILVIMLAFGVIFFINPAYEVKKVAYACGNPTETPTPCPCTAGNSNTIHKGTPQSGSLENACVLPETTTGLVHYRGDHDPNEDNWTSSTIWGYIQATVNYWNIVWHEPAIQYGDVSKKNGGKFDDHNSHQNGLDVDFRYFRVDKELTGCNPTTNPSDYWQEQMQRFIDTIEAQGNVQYIFVSTQSGLTGTHVNTNYSADHQNHIHVRYVDPDGTQN